MQILITGAKGFIGKNLMEALQQNTGHHAQRLLPVDTDTPPDELVCAAAQADFVFHLAGINRPVNTEDFHRGNVDFTVFLLSLLEKGKRPPVLLSSSTQAALNNPYGLSKRAAEEAVRAYGAQYAQSVMIYRLTNAFGKWSRPNYNSAVATFCHNIARGLPIQVNDPSAMLRLNYIDDITAELLKALEMNPTRDGDFCIVRPEHSLTLEQLTQTLYAFRDGCEPPQEMDSDLVRKLRATYLSFLPA